MNTNWNESVKKIKAFKAYMNGAPKSVAEKKGYLLTREEIQKILDQKDGSLDGIRIYFGADIVDDFMVPTLVVVGCEKDADDNYHDFDVPEKTLKTLVTNRAMAATVNGKTSVVAELKPCPNFCSKSNILNS